MRTDYNIYQPNPDGWIVLNTHPSKEQVALDNLARQEFRSYCPMLKRTIRHARRSREVLRPLFPGYVFVQASAQGQLWRPLLSTYGVRRVLQFSGQPARLDDALVSALKHREQDGVIVLPPVPYNPGDRVKLSGGAFDGLVASIISMDEKHRLVVLLDLLNRPVKVKLDVSQVAPIVLPA